MVLINGSDVRAFRHLYKAFRIYIKRYDKTGNDKYLNTCNSIYSLMEKIIVEGTNPSERIILSNKKIKNGLAMMKQVYGVKN